MTLTEEQKAKIKEENEFWNSNYSSNDMDRRKQFGQFFTPWELSIKMVEKFDDLSGTILDPCCGNGSLLAACIQAGADPKKVYGIELDPEILKVAQSRLSKLGVPIYNIHLGNALNNACYDFEKENDTKSYNFYSDKGENGTVEWKDKSTGKTKFFFGGIIN